MREIYLGLAVVGLVLFLCSALLNLWSQLSNRNQFQSWSLLSLSVIGPISLACCWQAQVLFQAEEAIFWARLMAGDTAEMFRLGSLGLIAGSALAMGGLSLHKNFPTLLIGAIAVGLMWWVVYLHPTPHYVPVPTWQDKLAWFLLLPGGSILGLLVYWKLKPYLSWLHKPIAMLSGVVSLLPVLTLSSFYISATPINLEPYSAQERIKAIGCLSCHTMKGVGYPDPGGPLSSVASRKEDTLRAFLLEPTADKAKELGISDKPTGKMSGVHLTEKQVDLLMESLKELFEVQPPSMLGPGLAHIEKILTENTCLACHTFQGEGAPEGGIGGPLEQARKHSKENLVKWLMSPDYVTAKEIGIREEPTGAMTAFSLPKEEAEQIAEWLLKEKQNNSE